MKTTICFFIFFILLVLSSDLLAQTEKGKTIPCLDAPSGNMPNPETYPQFYRRDNPIHKATVLHRRHLKCADDSLYEPEMEGEEEQIIVLHTSERDYCNYVCHNRKQGQCYEDGTFDTYYDEWCEDASGNRINPY